MKTEFEMSEDDLKDLLDACKPVPMMMLQCGTPNPPQENANEAWKKLGEKMGFDYMTVEPVSNKGQRFFIGGGVKDDPCRTVTQYHTKDGDFLAERDPISYTS